MESSFHYHTSMEFRQLSDEDIAERELMVNDYRRVCAEHGMQCWVTSSGASQVNGLVESRHRQLRETTIAMLYNAKLGPAMWPMAWQHSALLLNIQPHSTLYVSDDKLKEMIEKKLLPEGTPKFNVSPRFALTGTTYDARNLRVFGSTTFSYLKMNKGDLSRGRALRGIWVGLSRSGKLWKVIEPVSMREYMVTHATVIEDMRERCQFLEDLDKDLAQLKAKKALLDPVVLGIPDTISDLTPEQCDTIIRHNDWNHFRETIFCDPKSQFYDMKLEDGRLYRSSILDPDIPVGGEREAHNIDDVNEPDMDHDPEEVAMTVEDALEDDHVLAEEQSPERARAKAMADRSRPLNPSNRRCRRNLKKGEQMDSEARKRWTRVYNSEPTRVIIFRKTLPDLLQVKAPLHGTNRSASYYRYNGDGNTEGYSSATTVANYKARCEAIGPGKFGYPSDRKKFKRKVLEDFLWDADHGFLIIPTFDSEFQDVDPDIAVGDHVFQGVLNDPFVSSKHKQFILEASTPDHVQRMDTLLENDALVQHLQRMHLTHS
jgi:hypothetical protein